MNDQAQAAGRLDALDDGLNASAGLLWVCEGDQMMYVERRGDGRRVYKMVEAAAVAQAFSWQQMDTGWLPPGLVRWGRAGEGYFGVLHIPAARWKLRLGRLYGREGGERIITVHAPLPESVLLVCGTRVQVYAIPEGLKPKTRLFFPPVPNLYADGAVCFGSNRVAAIREPPDVPKIWELFVAAPFNSDMAGGRCRSHPDDVRRLLLDLGGAEQFPLDELVPFTRQYRGGQATLQEALDSLAGLERERADSLTLGERQLLSPDLEIRAAAVAEALAEMEQAEQGDQGGAS